MLKSDSTKLTNSKHSSEEKSSVLLKSDKTASYSNNNNSNSRTAKHQARNYETLNAQNNVADSNETRLSLLVKAAEKVDSVDMSNVNNNNNNNINNKNNNKLNELSAFLSTNSSILESQQQQNAAAMFGVGNVGSLTLVQQSQQNAASSVPLFIGKNGKPTRPFKAYPKESLSIPIVGSGNSAATISELINNHNGSSSSNNNNINNNNNSASSNNQKVILSANINALAHLLSQQHQMGNSGFGNASVVQGPLINPDTIVSLVNNLLNASAAAVATSTASTGNNNQPSLSHSFHQPTSNLSAIDHNIGALSGNMSDISLLFNGIQAGLGDESANSLNNIYNPNDFCVQHRKRIQQAQERLMLKLSTNTSSSSSTSLLLSQLTDLIPLAASANNNNNNNANQITASNSSSSTNSSTNARRRTSIGGSKRCSSTESTSSPVANNSTSNDQHNNTRAVSNKERRIETPDTTTSDLVVQESVQTTQDPVKQPKETNKSPQNNSSGQQQEEYMNYPPKKRHRIIIEQESQAENHNIEETSGDEPKSQSQSPTIPEAPIKTDNSTNNSVAAAAAEICETLLSRSTKSNSGTPPSVTGQRFSSVSSTRSRNSSIDDSVNNLGNTDDAYRERRRKNNEAAKRSRDARRAKEDDIALRAALLERENLQLKVELAQLKQETNRLRCLLYNS